MRTQSTILLLLCLGLLAPRGATARPIERVPEDGSLAQAIQRVSNRGTIDIAPGTYAAPANGLRIRNTGVTLSARDGGEVVIEGQGGPIFEVKNRGVDNGETVAFEGITFRGGLSADSNRAGAVTVDGAIAVFASCVFDSNRSAADQSRGGAVQVRGAAVARFVNTRFTDNVAGQGGAIFAIEESRLYVVWSEFRRNLNNLPDLIANPAGGAIYVLDSEAHVTSSYFEDNASVIAGGAIFALGNFGGPGALVEVENSTFVGNRVDRIAGAPVGPPSGGAIHVENQALARLDTSRFFENFATFGGAVSTFRARVEVDDSVFRGNFAIPESGVTAAGGTFNVTSIAPNVGRLRVANSFVQGRFGATTIAATTGGCLFASGESTDRAIVELRNVAFADCDVETAAEGTGRGGAITASQVDLTLDDSLVVDSDAFGADAEGGAVFAFNDTILRATGTTFARNSAEKRGGAIRMAGGRIEVADAFFLENDVSPAAVPGTGEQVQNAPGAALDLGPSSRLDLGGSVANSVFTGNVGLPIVDLVNNSAGTFNNVVYLDNDVHSTSYGNLVYKNQEQGFGGLTVGQLNGLTLRGIDKGDDNTRLASAPRKGHLAAVPPNVLTTASPDPGDETPTRAFLVSAWSGGGSARVNNRPAFSESVDVDDVGRARTYRLEVDGDQVDSRAVGEMRCSGGGIQCLNGERFLVDLFIRDFAGKVVDASAVTGPFADSGLFFFFSEDNWEMLVKVLDGCGITDHFWVFAAATTNVEYTLRVTDKESGVTKAFFNPLGNAAAAITDTSALAACDGKLARTPAPAREAPALDRSSAVDGGAERGGSSCVPNQNRLCLNESRFRLEVDWRDFSGNSGAAQVFPFGTDDSGLFFFFSEDNLEMLVKVLTGCNINNRYWVFAAATTTVEYTLRVMDTETGAVKTFFNPLGNAAAAVTDTDAFATCP